MGIVAAIPSFVNSASRLRIAATHQIRSTLDTKPLPFSTGTPAPLVNDQAAYLALTKKKVDPLTTSEEKALLDKPQGIIEETLNALDSKQQEIKALTKKLDKAKTDEQRKAIQSELNGQVADYNQIQKSEKFTNAMDVLKQFRAQLTKAQSPEDRKAAKDFLLANRGIVGERIAKFLSSASDEDAKSFIGRLASATSTELTTEGDKAGVLRGSDEGLSDDEQISLTASSHHVLSLKFDTADNRKISLAFLNGLSNSFAKIADQLTHGNIENLTPTERTREVKDPIKDPHAAASAVEHLKKTIEGTTLLRLLDANDDLDRSRAKHLLQDF